MSESKLLKDYEVIEIIKINNNKFAYVRRIPLNFRVDEPRYFVLILNRTRWKLFCNTSCGSGFKSMETCRKMFGHRLCYFQLYEVDDYGDPM
jgi:hypothetical protein